MPVRLCAGAEPQRRGRGPVSGSGPAAASRCRQRAALLPSAPPKSQRTATLASFHSSCPEISPMLLPVFFLYTFSFPYGKITHWRSPPSGLCRSCHFSGGLLLGHSFLFHCRTYIVNPPMWIDIFSYLLLANISQFFHSIFNKSC